MDMMSAQAHDVAPIPGTALVGPLDAGRQQAPILRQYLRIIVNQIEELAKFTAGIGRLEGFQSKVESISQTNPTNNQNVISDYPSILIKMPHAGIGSSTPCTVPGGKPRTPN